MVNGIKFLLWSARLTGMSLEHQKLEYLLEEWISCLVQFTDLSSVKTHWHPVGPSSHPQPLEIKPAETSHDVHLLMPVPLVSSTQNGTMSWALLPELETFELQAWTEFVSHHFWISSADRPAKSHNGTQRWAGKSTYTSATVTCPKFLASLCFKSKFKRLLMHYSQKKVSPVSPTYARPHPLMIQAKRRKVRQRRNGGVQRMDFLSGTQSSHPRGGIFPKTVWIFM